MPGHAKEPPVGFWPATKPATPGKGAASFMAANHPAPRSTKNAVTTGAYEEIVYDRLPDTERELYGRIDPSPRAQAEQEIRLLTIRECRMLARI